VRTAPRVSPQSPHPILATRRRLVVAQTGRPVAGRRKAPRSWSRSSWWGSCPTYRRPLERTGLRTDGGRVIGENGSAAIATGLADLLDNARPVPLLRDRVRVDRREIDRRLDELVNAVRAEVADHSLDKTAGFDLLQTAADVRDARMHAYPIPLTDQIRLPRARAAEMAASLRAASPR
jgi:hypothetical protein